MSMNINLRACLKCFSMDGRNYKPFYERCELYQTPTDVSYKIELSENKYQTYCDWVYSLSKNEESKKHCDYVKDWIDEHEFYGWSIEWYVQ